MSLVLTIVNGDRAGESVPVSDGLTIGRQGADLALADRRVSGLHAYVRGDDRGGWMIVDNGSKNGIRDGRGERAEMVTLCPQAQFTIGDVVFRVDLVGERRAEPAAPAVAPPAAPAVARPTASPGAASKRYWYEVLATFLNDHAVRFKDRPRPLTALEPALVLEFVRGPQVSSKWILGFGPRQVGPASLDLPLWGEDLPDVCFEILPASDGILFKTGHADVVQLNGGRVDSRILRIGDVIQIKDTIIEVDFSE